MIMLQSTTACQGLPLSHRHIHRHAMPSPGSMAMLMVGPGFQIVNNPKYAAFITITGPIFIPVVAAPNGHFNVTILSGVADEAKLF